MDYLNNDILNIENINLAILNKNKEIDKINKELKIKNCSKQSNSKNNTLRISKLHKLLNSCQKEI